MNVRMLWLGCAQSLLALSLAGCCCCESAVPRANCGRAAKHHPAGHCGSAQGCGRAAPKLVQRPLFKFEQVCPHGFPPYNPAPFGYATGLPHVVEASISRHVEFGPSTSQAGPRQTPAELPSVVDQNAKRLPAEDATDAPHADPSATKPDVKTPDVKSPAALAQPNHAPRTTEPPPSADASAEDAPSPDSEKQPVSVPAPADKPRDDLPSNPLRGGEKNAPEAEAPTPGTDAKAPASEPQPTPAEEHPDAPAPKSSNDGDDDDKEPADSQPNDGSEEEWPDAPLPKNDLPPLAGPVR